MDKESASPIYNQKLSLITILGAVISTTYSWDFYIYGMSYIYFPICNIHVYKHDPKLGLQTRFFGGIPFVSQIVYTFSRGHSYMISDSVLANMKIYQRYICLQILLLYI